jgi:hypothetical protein
VSFSSQKPASNGGRDDLQKVGKLYICIETEAQATSVYHPAEPIAGDRLRERDDFPEKERER